MIGQNISVAQSTGGDKNSQGSKTTTLGSVKFICSLVPLLKSCESFPADQEMFSQSFKEHLVIENRTL